MNDINLQSENLLDTYKENEKEISRLQLTVLEQKSDLEKTDLYKCIKDNEAKIRLLQTQNENYKENVKSKMLENGLKSLETFSHKITVK
jgi:HD superfamily phosphohydrolase